MEGIGDDFSCVSWRNNIHHIVDKDILKDDMGIKETKHQVVGTDSLLF
jgi:hypothetical protein